MQTSKKIKLIYDFYENDIAYVGFEQETKIDRSEEHTSELQSRI